MSTWNLAQSISGPAGSLVEWAAEMQGAKVPSVLASNAPGQVLHYSPLASVYSKSNLACNDFLVISNCQFSVMAFLVFSQFRNPEIINYGC